MTFGQLEVANESSLARETSWLDPYRPNKRRGGVEGIQPMITCTCSKMAAKYIEGEAQRERADLRQQFAAIFPLDEPLPTLLVENVLTNFEFAQFLPTPRSTVADRNHGFLVDKKPSAVSLTLSILARPEHLDHPSFEEMLREVFDVEEQENGTGGIPSATLQQEGARVSGAREVSPVWPLNTRVVQY